MIEKLIPLKLPPGVFRNGTKYQAAVRWYDSNLIRWIDGTIQPIGGWRRAEAAAGGPLGALTGVPRGAISWRSAVGQVKVAIGTHTKAYAIVDGVSYDITPAAGFTTGDQDSVYAGGSGTYGSGAYGSGVYGTGSLALVLDEADTWQFDTFGDFLVACFSEDGKIWSWDGNTANKLVQVTGSPTQCRGVVCTPERFLVALGAANNSRLVQWASQETTTTWTPASTNTAGDFELATNGRIMAGRRTKKQTLIWTDTELHTMNYIGGSLVYAFDQAGANCGLLAPNAIAMVDTLAFWMGRDNFFVYDGYVKPLPSEVRDYVFNDFNGVQAAKVFAVSISEFGEVWWFYPSANSIENDRYVAYNYREDHWSIGRLSRTAGFDRGATPYPSLCDATGAVYEHEVNEDRGTEVPYLESGPIEIGEGDRVMRVQRIVPDENTLGDARLYLYSSFFPTQAETLNGPYTVGAPTDVRLTARQVRLKIEQANETNWRVGTPRLGVIAGGRR